MNDLSPSRRDATKVSLPLRVVLVALLAIALTPLFNGGYLPFIDLPQHAAQLAVAERFDNGQTTAIDSAYVYNPYVNHRVAYALADLFMTWTSVEMALRLVLSLAVIGLPLSALWLLRRTGGDPWWCIGTIPLGYGFSTYWGFLNYVVAIPIGIVLIAEAFHYSKRPSPRGAISILLLGLLLFVSHVLVLAFAGLVGGSLILLARQPWRARFVGLLALAGTIPPFVLWWWKVQTVAPPQTFQLPTRLAYSWERLPGLLAFQVDGMNATTIETLLGALLLLSPFALGAKLTRDGRLFVPLACTLLTFGLLPSTFAGVAYLFGRYAVFALPMSFIALRGAQWTSGHRRVLGSLRAALVLIVVATSMARAAETRAFAEESRSFDAAISHIPKHERIVYLPFRRWRTAPLEPGYLHFGQWYAVKRGGIVDFSFAEFFPNRYRYSESSASRLITRIEWTPDRYDPICGASQYQFVLARGRYPKKWVEEGSLSIVAQEEDWSVLKSSSAGQCAKQEAVDRR